MSLFAEARVKSELATLQRSFSNAFTALDIARRKWAKLGKDGKDALANCVNSQSLHTHLEVADLPSVLQQSVQAHRGVQMQVLRARRNAQVELRSIMGDLEDIVRGMHTTVTELQAKLNVSKRALGVELLSSTRLLHTESAMQLLSRAQAMVSLHDRELKLRQAVVAEVVGSGRKAALAQSGWDETVRIYLAAWVLEPYLEEGHSALLCEALDAEARASPNPGRRRS